MKNIPVFCFFLVLAFLSCKQLDKDEETETDETGGTTTVAVTGITLDKTSGYLLPGRTIQLTATVAPANATNKTYAWSSTNVSVATVSAAGLVTGVGYGTATIAATTADGAKTATFAATIPVLPSIAAGGSHSMWIKLDGTLWGWGENGAGEVGDWTDVDKWSPVQVGTATNWKSVSSGDASTLAIRTDGTLWAWGANGNGYLGDGTTTERWTPVQIGTDTDWKQVSIGASHTLAVKSNGTLWSWGSDGAGQLGNGAVSGDQWSPVQIGAATNWAKVFAGTDFSLALKTDGTLWAWGSNTTGQLGIGNVLDQVSPVQVGTATDWTEFEAGAYHTVALKTDGSLWAWGDNSSGQLGDGTFTAQYSPVRIGAASD